MFGGSASARTIQTVLSAEDRATAKLDSVEAAGDRTADSMSQVEQQLDSVTKMMAVTGAATAALGGGILALNKRFGKLDETFATIQETSGATAEEMERIREATKGVATDMPVRLSAAAAGARELSYAGLSATQTMAALNETSQLAVASNLRTGEAAQVVARSLDAFELEARQTNAVVGALGQSFSESTTSVQGLSNALTEVQATANAAGLSVAETTASLGLLASSGLAGSKGGTALAATLRKLTSGSGQTKQALDELGLSIQDFTDESGTLRELPAIMQTLSMEMNNVESQAERLRIANQLVGARGARALIPMIRKTEDLTNRVENNLRAEIQGAIGDISRMNDTELETTSQTLGIQVSDETTGTELITNLQRLANEEGENAAQIASRLQIGLGLTGDAAEMLAQDITQTNKSAEELASALDATTTAEELAEAQTRTLSGQVTQLRSDLQVIGYEMQQGTEPAVSALVGGLRSLTTPIAENEQAAKALGGGLVGLTGVLGLATAGLATHAAQLKLTALAQKSNASATLAGSAALRTHTVTTAAASKAQALMTMSTGQLIAATRAKSASLFTSITALGSNTAATLANASAKGILAGAASAAIAPALALNAALGPIGLIALAAAGGLAALTAIAGGDLLGAGDEAAAVLGFFGEKAETAYLAGSQLLGILYEIGRIGVTLGGLALIAPFAGLLKLPEVPSMIRSTIPEAKAAAAELPSEVIAGLNSMGRARYLVPVIGPLMGLHDLITGVGPEAKQAAAKLPAQVIAGLGSPGAAQYLVPVIGPLMGLHDLITGVGPEAKEAAAQLPAQVIAGLDSMDQARYLAPVIGPLMSLQNPISGVGQEAKQAAAQLPAQVITGLDSLGPAQYALPVIGPMLAIRDGINRFGPEVKEAAAQLPTQVIAGLNSMGPARYTLPILGPLLGLHGLITGVGPEAKEAAAQLPVQVIAGLDSMPAAQYLIPILGPMLAARDALTNPDEWVKSGEQIPAMIASGIANRASEPVDEVTDVVSGIRSRLPFSPAEKGPLATIDESGPGLVRTLATGIESEAPVLTSTLENVFGATSLGMAVDADSAVVAGQSLARDGSDGSSSRRPARSRQDEPRINITLEQTNEFGATTGGETVRRDVQKATLTGGRDALGELELLLRRTLSEADQ